MKKAQIKTRIDTTLWFDSIHDPRIERYMRRLEKKARLFREKYYGRTNFLKKIELFIEFLEDIHDCLELFGENKVSMYFSLQSDLHMYDEKIKAASLSYQERTIKAHDLIYFYRFVLAKTSKKKQKEFLRSRRVSKYRYWLLGMFDKEGMLSEKEETLMALLEEPAYDNWVTYARESINAMTVRYGGKKLRIAQASAALESLRGRKRYALNDLIDRKYKSVASITNAELNSIVRYHLLCSEYKGFKNPYSDILSEYQIHDESMVRLTDYVTKLFPVGHRFYELHAQLLGKKTIQLCDTSLPVGKVKRTFKFVDSLHWHYEGLATVDKSLARLLMKYISNGQFDVFPRKGKDSNSQTRVSDGGKLLGYAILDCTKGVSFMEFLKDYFAHEGGHIWHAELSKKQPSVYREFSGPVAETAAFFYDRVVFDNYFQSLTSENEKLGGLHFLLKSDFASLFFQTMLFNFQVELHAAIKEKKFLSIAEMVKMMKKHLELCYGPAVRITDNDATSLLATMNIRDFFYVCSYPFASIFHMIMFARWKEDKSYYQKIKKSFSAGSSDDVASIFKKAGINIDNPKLFDIAINEINLMLDQLEILMASKK